MSSVDLSFFGDSISTNCPFAEIDHAQITSADNRKALYILILSVKFGNEAKNLTKIMPAKLRLNGDH